MYIILENKYITDILYKSFPLQAVSCLPKRSHNPEMVDISALLDRIEKVMATAPPEAQWTMNFSLAEIEIHHPEHRERAINIGGKLGIYRDFPVSKGCTSPFAPI